jgi:hypothetical protein
MFRCGQAGAENIVTGALACSVSSSVDDNLGAETQAAQELEIKEMDVDRGKAGTAV